MFRKRYSVFHNIYLFIIIFFLLTLSTNFKMPNFIVELNDEITSFWSKKFYIFDSFKLRSKEAFS